MTALKPDNGLILDIMHGTKVIGFVATAKAKDYDFVSRYFAPEEGTGITEHTVTAAPRIACWRHSGRSALAKKLKAYQASYRWRRTFLQSYCGVKRTILGGYVQHYLQGLLKFD